MNGAEEAPSPDPVRRHLTYYVALLALIVVCCATATFSYFATYPSLRSTAVGVAHVIFWGFPAVAPVVFALAFLLPRPDLIAAAKIHASLYTAYTLVLVNKLGLANHTIPILIAVASIELVTLMKLVQCAPKGSRQLRSAPWLFTGLTCAVLAGFACGALLWRAAVRAEIVDVAPAEGKDLQRHSGENDERNPVMRPAG